MQPQRHSIRLKDYDYAQAGAYFVTICVKDRACVLGMIENEKMQLSDYGKLVSTSWEWLAQQYAYVELDAWAIMPNHLHGIVFIHDNLRGGSRTAPTVSRKTLGRLIGAFKTVSTKQINAVRNISGLPFWQRNYYEHVIRNEDDLFRVRTYIVNNPLQWALDDENPDRH